MRILQVSSARDFGGGERHLVDLCRGLRVRGHEVFVALRPTNEWQRRLDFIRPENIFHVSIRNSFGILSAMKIAEFVRENKIEIVHAHVARDYVPASIACMRARPAKFVLTRHVLFPLKPFNKYALKNLSWAIGVSEAVGGALRKVFPPSKVTVIANGLDIDNYSNEDEAKLRDEFRSLHNIPRDAPLVGTLGELKELKGQRDFVLAANEIAKKIPDCRFVVVGKDNTYDKAFRRELKRLVKVLGHEDRFLWLDWLENTAPFFAAIDVFVSPSHSESFGLALLEAMARGKALVATATEGAKELLGSNANLAGVKEPLDLSAAITKLLIDENLRIKSGKSNQNIAGEKFSLTRMIDETEELYLSCL